jgi:hypothetical protein
LYRKKLKILFSQLLIQKTINFVEAVFENLDSELFNHFIEEKIQIEIFVIK